LPKDANQLAAEIVRLPTEEPKQTHTIKEYLSSKSVKVVWRLEERGPRSCPPKNALRSAAKLPKLA